MTQLLKGVIRKEGIHERIVIRGGFNSFEEIIDGNCDDRGGVQLIRIVIREGEQKEEFSETFAVLDKDQDTVISREGHH